MNIALLSFSYYPANEYAIASEQLWVCNTEFSIGYIYASPSGKEAQSQAYSTSLLCGDITVDHA
jgi:hypothetical protein